MKTYAKKRLGFCLWPRLIKVCFLKICLIQTINKKLLGSPVASEYPLYNLIGPSDDIQLLQLENSTNRQLNDNFNKISKEIPLFVTLLELEKTAILGRKKIIVPLDSGFFESGKIYHLQESHHQICKPKNQNSTIYYIVLNFINDALRYINKDRR